VNEDSGFDWLNSLQTPKKASSIITEPGLKILNDSISDSFEWLLVYVGPTRSSVSSVHRAPLHI